MSSVPRPSKIEFDRSGNSHLICVENEAINLVFERLKAFEYILQNFTILQLVGAKKSEAASNIEQFDSIANLESRLIEICDRAYMGMRFYAVGSEQFVWHLRGCARSFGLSEESINLEVVDRQSKNIYCSNCQSINSSIDTTNPTCSSCGIKLEVIDHFSRLKNAYLGICADAESIEEPSKIEL